MRGAGKGSICMDTHARLVSADVPGCLETSLRDCASIWSSERLTDGRSGRER